MEPHLGQVLWDDERRLENRNVKRKGDRMEVGFRPLGIINGARKRAV